MTIGITGIRMLTTSSAKKKKNANANVTGKISNVAIKMYSDI